MTTTKKVTTTERRFTAAELARMLAYATGYNIDNHEGFKSATFEPVMGYNSPGEDDSTPKSVVGYKLVITEEEEVELP